MASLPVESAIIHRLAFAIDTIPDVVLRLLLQDDMAQGALVEQERQRQFERGETFCCSHLVLAEVARY